MISKTHTKYIQSLQHKKFRDEHRVFIAEGPKVVPDLLLSGKFICKEIFALDNWLKEHHSLCSLYPATAFTTVEDFELEKISALQVPNKVLAIFEYQEERALRNNGGKITLVLDTIQDPGNLGTIIRIADWFGIDDIICSAGCADRYNPKVVQSTMGSLGRVNVFYSELITWLKHNKGIPVYAATLNGKPLSAINSIREGIIIIGNESRGIDEAILELAHEEITIPKKGSAESLNAAVAAGIILSHIA